MELLIKNRVVTFDAHHSLYIFRTKPFHPFVDWVVQGSKKISMVVGNMLDTAIILSYEIIDFRCCLTFKHVKKGGKIGQVQAITFLLNEKEYYLDKNGNYYFFICPLVLRTSYIQALEKLFLLEEKDQSFLCMLIELAKTPQEG